MVVVIVIVAVFGIHRSSHSGDGHNSDGGDSDSCGVWYVLVTVMMATVLLVYGVGDSDGCGIWYVVVTVMMVTVLVEYGVGDRDGCGVWFVVATVVVAVYDNFFISVEGYHGTRNPVTLIAVFCGSVQSSKRIRYPTSWPIKHPFSSATRMATLMKRQI